MLQKREYCGLAKFVTESGAQAYGDSYVTWSTIDALPSLQLSMLLAALHCFI
jgi:hypothetical protein